MVISTCFCFPGLLAQWPRIIDTTAHNWQMEQKYWQKWINRILCIDIVNQKVQPPYGGLLSSSCGGLKSPLGPKVILTNRRTNGQTDGWTTGLRELDRMMFQWAECNIHFSLYKVSVASDFVKVFLLQIIPDCNI